MKIGSSLTEVDTPLKKEMKTALFSCSGHSNLGIFEVNLCTSG